MEDGGLPFKAKNRAIHIGLVQQHTGVIDQIARGEIIRAVDNDVVFAEQIESIRAGQARLVGVDANRRIHASQAFFGGLNFGPPDVARGKCDLPLEIGVIDDVEINDPEPPYACRGQIKPQRRAQPARADHEHLGFGQLELPVHAHFGHDQMAAVALNFLLGKCAPSVRNSGRAGNDRHDGSPSDPLYFRAAGDRGHNADRIAVFGGRVFLLQVANILVVEVDIHETANAAVVSVKVLAQIGVGSRKLFQGLADGGRIELHACLLARKLPQGGRNFHLHCHVCPASSVTPQLNLSTQSLFLQKQNPRKIVGGRLLIV